MSYLMSLEPNFNSGHNIGVFIDSVCIWEGWLGASLSLYILASLSNWKWRHFYPVRLITQPRQPRSFFRGPVPQHARLRLIKRHLLKRGVCWPSKKCSQQAVITREIHELASCLLPASLKSAWTRQNEPVNEEHYPSIVENESGELKLV